jgi:hypothetical protein
MAKRELKNWSLIFAAIFALLVAPIASAAFACAMHDVKKSDGHAANQITENDCHSAATHAKTEEHAENDCETALIQNGCCCAKKAPERSALSEKKSVQNDNFNGGIAGAHFEFFAAARTKSIQFYRPEIIYPARGALSEKPSRSPPSL